jgi:hypothetical protein
MGKRGRKPKPAEEKAILVQGYLQPEIYKALIRKNEGASKFIQRLANTVYDLNK